MSCHGVWTEPGMWPASHSLRSRTSRTWTSSRAPAARRRGSRSIRATGRFSCAPARHAAVQEAGEARGCRPPRRAGRRARPSSSSRPTKHDVLLAVGQPGEPGAEAGVEHRDRRSRRGCARRRTAGRCARRRAARRPPRCCSTWRGASGSSSTPVGEQRPAVERRRSRWKFGGCGPSPASACVDELVLVVDRQRRRCARARSRSSRRSSCPSPGRRTSSRRGGRARPRRRPGSASSLPCSERKIPRAPSDFSIARSGRATSLTNSVSPVSTAHGSSPRRGVDQREGGVLGPVPGRVQRAHAQRAELAARRRRRTARGRTPGAASRWMWIVAPVAAASRPWPDTWSAWLWVSKTCSMRTPM